MGHMVYCLPLAGMLGVGMTSIRKEVHWVTHPFAGAPELIPLMESVQIQLREVGVELELEETDWIAKVIPTMRDRKASGYLAALPPSKKAVEAQSSVFNVGKAIVHQFETDAIYQM